MHREPDVGFDPGSPGSRPGPKAGAKPLRHPGIPLFLLGAHNLLFHLVSDCCTIGQYVGCMLYFYPSFLVQVSNSVPSLSVAEPVWVQ